MPVISAAEAAELTLGQTDAMEVDWIARGLHRGPDDQVDNSACLAAARQSSCSLPYRLRRGLRQFRRDPGLSGSMIVHGFPVRADELPPTPDADGSVQRAFGITAAMLMVAACELGDPIAFRAEKSGALVQDVVPVPGCEDVRGDAGSALLPLRNDNAFRRHRPDFVMLLCLRAGHDRMAGLRIASARELLPALSGAAVTTLFSREFVTKPPPLGYTGDLSAPHAVLTGAAEDPDMRLDVAATMALTSRAQLALQEVNEVLDQIAHTLRLVPGDLAIVDNRMALHGRTAFRPRYDGRDRWLQRTLVAADLRRSRDLRPRDSHVLVG